MLVLRQTKEQFFYQKLEVVINDTFKRIMKRNWFFVNFGERVSFKANFDDGIITFYTV
jgi:hypothetical protein